jgi:hypothetical protein
VIRYVLSTTGGSSGSGLYDTATKRIFGIHSQSEVDPVCVLPGAESSITSSKDQSVAIAFTAPEFQGFVRTLMIPQFVRTMGTAAARSGMGFDRLWVVYGCFSEGG